MCMEEQEGFSLFLNVHTYAINKNDSSYFEKQWKWHRNSKKTELHS